MSFGPIPWQQTNWDWRAAANFVCGGAGAGLIVVSVLSGAAGPVLATLILCSLALVAFGLFCVWLEIGRPLRALHVFFNPRTSWMSREAIAATLLFPAGLGAALAVPGCAVLAAVLALAFVFCQGRMLRAAKGIVAWREPMIVPLILSTGLAEGAGLLLLAAPLLPAGSQAMLSAFAALLLLRMLTWAIYRQRLAAVAAAQADVALARAALTLKFAGTILPLALLVAIVAGAPPEGLAAALAATAGLLAAAAGAYMKFTIVTAAGFNQGFALAHLPVRGRRR